MAEEVLYKKYDDGEVEKLLEIGFGLIDTNGITTEDAADRAAKFLRIQGVLTDRRREAATEVSLARADAKAEWAEALRRLDGKAVTEKKELAHGDPCYRTKVKKQEEDEASLRRLDDMSGIFENAHVLLRGLSRDRGF